MRTQTGSVCVSAQVSYSPLFSNCAAKAERRSSLSSAMSCTSANAPALTTLTAICPPSSGMTSITMPEAM